MKVYKYKLENGVNVLNIPAWAVFVSVGEQDNEIMLWAVIHTNGVQMGRIQRRVCDDT